MKDKVIETGKSKRVRKSPWEHKTRKGRGCLRKVNGLRMLKRKMGQEPASNVIKKPK